MSAPTYEAERRRAGRLVFVALAGATLAACALTGKSDPLTPRYFSPDVAAPTAAASQRRSGGEKIEVRLGRVSASGYLSDRIVYRTNEHELGFYEERRWTERPDAYLRRALARSLFEEGGAARMISGTAPTLDVELIGFEEIRATPPLARARATLLLYEGRAVLREQTITVERPIRVATSGANTPEATVRSLSEAMAGLVAQVTAAVLASVPAVPAGEPARADHTRTRTDAGAP